MSVTGSHPDLHLTHWNRKCPGKANLKSSGPVRRPGRKTLPSSHCRQRRCISALRPDLPARSSIPPDGMSCHSHKYSDRIPHPCKHASGSGNPGHCSLRSDIRSCPDKSSHLRMYLTILSPAPRTGPLPETPLIRRVPNAPEYAAVPYCPQEAYGMRWKTLCYHHRFRSGQSLPRFFYDGEASLLP